jgi:hypothetical protein
MADIKWNDRSMAEFYMFNILDDLFPNVFDAESTHHKLEKILANRIQVDSSISSEIYGSEPNEWRVVTMFIERIVSKKPRLRVSDEEEINEWLDDNF